MAMHGLISAARNGAPVFGSLEAEADAVVAVPSPMMLSCMLSRRSAAGQDFDTLTPVAGARLQGLRR